MKRILLIALMLSAFNLWSQEESEKGPVSLVVTNGIDFVQNDSLIDVYNGNTRYFFGVGFESFNRNLEIPKFLIQYSFSKSKVQDSVSFSQHNFFLGGSFPMYATSKFALSSKFGVLMVVSNDFNPDLSYVTYGAQMGVEVEKVLIKDTKVFSSLTYNYQHVTTKNRVNLDMIRLAFGFKFRM